MTSEGQLPSAQPMPTDVTPPLVIADGAAGDGQNQEADLSMWLVPAGLSLLFLLIALVLLRRRKPTGESAENDGAATVKKHSVFGKPTNSLS